MNENPDTLPANIAQLRYALIPMLQDAANLRAAGDLIDRFRSEVLGQQQYAGHLGRKDLALVELTRNQRAKSGVVGVKGQRLVAYPADAPNSGKPGIMVHSPWTNFDVWIPAGSYRVIAAVRAARENPEA